MSLWSDPDLQKLFLSSTPLIDVRAPIEFSEGLIPHSVNLPLVVDEERHLIGICYKDQGQDAAIELGHKLVSGDLKKARIQQWLEFLTAHPTAQVFCFRGGLRSQISCQWISEQGIPRTPIEGGYKRLRQFFLSWLNEAPLPQTFRIGGLTGSGKTKLLLELAHHVDLEAQAHHRGSAFGSLGPQPSQITFENELAMGLLRNPKLVIMEDESVMLGRLRIPTRFYKNLSESPMVILNTSLEERIQNIFTDYVLQKDAEFFLSATQSISKKLGGDRTTLLSDKIKKAFNHGLELVEHQEWIHPFLVDYYDPLYARSLQRNKDVILFEGNAQAIKDWWSQKSISPS